jgi:16S rRNA (cytidine1402-2'-O)-methyltransferase
MTSTVPFRHIVGKSARDARASTRAKYELNPMATPDHPKTATRTAGTTVPPARRYRVLTHDFEAARPPPGLYLVATPIGNLKDVTLRALEILAGVDVVACEDTRVTHKLFERYGISTPLVAYHDHNAPAARPKLIARLDAGEAVALVSDAGTPLISDPGFKLVREAQAAGHKPTDRFLFEGFLPPRGEARRARLAELADVPATLVFFETGPRIAAMLHDLAAVLGERAAAVCRELTKLHEDVRRADLLGLAHAYEDAAAETRGEFVVVVGPPAADARIGDADLDALLRRALASASLKNAVEAVAAATGQKRRLVYQRALALAKDPADGED